MFRENQEIGPFTLVRRFGRGSFGEVWLARRRGVSSSAAGGAPVVIKLPAAGELDREILRQEITLWAKIGRHPNVLEIFDAGEEGGQIYIACEYLPDGTLEELLGRYGRLPLEKAVEMTAGILDGLEFLHYGNVILRHLSLGDVLLRGREPVIGEFILARAAWTTAAARGGMVLAPSTAPEVPDGEYSRQSDLWSAGVILYQLLAGSFPFPRKETPQLFSTIKTGDHQPLPDFVPPVLNRIVARALAKRPEDRYRTAAEMRGDLRRASSLNYDSPPTHHGGAGFPHAEVGFPPPPGSAGSQAPSIARDDKDVERKTDSVGNIVNRVRNFFRKN